jgi:demethylmenaquinone methyltransferase/2-methoxy-6-polyprenyl-1,4-benzoquinol methylase
MFDRIAHRYDLLNPLLSGNLDTAWRARMCGLLAGQANLRALDLATGTADQLISLCKTGQIRSGVGLDPSGKMLALGQQKIERHGYDDKLQLVLGTAEKLPFEDDSFDVVTITFGIRNVVDVHKSLGEMHRVLTPGGKLLILEFSLPSNSLIRPLYLLYLRHILPRLGAVISGNPQAYRYLNQTVESFPHGETFGQMVISAGFVEVELYPLTFGVATIYRGIK